MNDAVIRFSLDLNRARHQNIVATQRLNTATTLVVNLRVGGVPYSIGEGCSARILIEKPAGTKTFADCVCDDDKVAYTFTENDLATVGTLVCQIIVTQLVHGVTERLSTPRFEIINNAGINVSDVVDSDDFAALTNALALADDFDQRITALEDELADIAETADAASETADEAKTIAQAASSTATAAQTAAATATTAANAASTAAAAAQNTANTAATKADEAKSLAQAASVDATTAKSDAASAKENASRALSTAQEALDAIDDIDVQSNFWFGTQDEFDLVNPSADVFYVIVPDPEPEPGPDPEPEPEPEPEPSGDYEVVDGAIAGFGETVITPLTATAGQLSSCSLQSDDNHIYGTITYTGFTYNSSASSLPDRLILFEITEPDWIYSSAEDSILSIDNVSYLGNISNAGDHCYIQIDNSENINVSNASLVITIDIPKAGGT